MNSSFNFVSRKHDQFEIFVEPEWRHAVPCACASEPRKAARATSMTSSFPARFIAIEIVLWLTVNISKRKFKMLLNGRVRFGLVLVHLRLIGGWIDEGCRVSFIKINRFAPFPNFCLTSGRKISLYASGFVSWAPCTGWQTRVCGLWLTGPLRTLRTPLENHPSIPAYSVNPSNVIIV